MEINQLHILAYQCYRDLSKISNDLPDQEKITLQFLKSNVTRRVGTCQKLIGGNFLIKIHPNFANEKDATDTIMHELIHCLPNCFNHGSNFVSKMLEVNNLGIGYDVSISSNRDEIAFDESKAYDVFTCDGCSQKYVLMRKTRTLKHIEELYDESKNQIVRKGNIYIKCSCGCTTWNVIKKHF